MRGSSRHRVSLRPESNGPVHASTTKTRSGKAGSRQRASSRSRERHTSWSLVEFEQNLGAMDATENWTGRCVGWGESRNCEARQIVVRLSVLWAIPRGNAGRVCCCCSEQSPKPRCKRKTHDDVEEAFPASNLTLSNGYVRHYLSRANGVISMKCLFKRPNGRECRANPVVSSAYCFFHDPARAAERRKAQSKGGLGTQVMSLPHDTPHCDVTSIEGVVGLLDSTINDVRRGKLDPKLGTTIGYLAGMLLRSFELSVDLKDRENTVRNSGGSLRSTAEESAGEKEETLVEKLRIIYGLAH
jgi:hypothetical protein